MRAQRLRTFFVKTIVGLSVALAALAPVRAQSFTGIRANVPFDFVVGSKKLQAGDYYFRPASSGQGVLAISNSEGTTSLRLLAGFAERPFAEGEARLVFYRHEDVYFLREVWMTREAGYKLPESGAHRWVARVAAHGGSQNAEVVTVAAGLQ